jgi:HNH endonuclease
MDEPLQTAVVERAGGLCEYCRLPQDLHPVPFEIDHIVARQHGGPTVLSNLALACLHCNGHKGPNIAGIDPLTKKVTKLFNPRRHKWAKHFAWNGPEVVGRTPVGRVTVVVLAMNDPVRVALRQELINEKRFPPNPA